MRDFLTQPKTATPRFYQSPADHASPITIFAKQGKARPWLDILLAVGVGVGLGVLLAWRG